MDANTTGTGSQGTGPFEGVASAARAFESLLEPPEANQEEEEAAQEEVVEDETELEASDEEELELDDESDPEAEESDDEPEGETEYFTVKVDGKEEQVTLEELQQGYQRTADYTRKTQQLAEERKAAEAELEAARAERAEYADLLPRLRQSMELSLGPGPDWAQLRQQDPVRAANLWQEREEQRRKLETIKVEEQRALAQYNADQERVLEQRMIEERNSLLSKVEEWRDPKVAQQESEAIRAMMAEVGYAEDEQVILDHRQMVIARKAMLYDQAVQKRKGLDGKVAKAPVVKPGGGTRKKASPALRASDRLEVTGSIKDAAAAFAHLLPD